jgi:hypothetical protein
MLPDRESSQVESVEYQVTPAATATPYLRTNTGRLAPLLRRGILGLVAVATLAFGGVHESVYLPLCALIFIAGAALLTDARSVRTALSGQPISQKLLAGFAVLLVFCVAQSLLFFNMNSPHPVAGVGTKLLDLDAALRGLLCMAACFVFTFLVAVLLRGEHHGERAFFRALQWLGFLVALIALGHWYYDSGKLFWYFEPQHVFVSERARWPFVNSNHLGTFLLPFFFLFLADLSTSVSQLGSSNARRGPMKLGPALSHIATSVRAQSKIMRLLVSTAALITIGITLIATLSRGTWAGLAAGLLVWLLMMRKDNQLIEYVQQSEPRPESRSGRDRRHRRSVEKRADIGAFLLKLKAFLRPALALLIVCFTIFFLNERGRELLSNRLDFGLMYSKDDIRWQMYSDSLPLLKENFLFGVGFRSWGQEFPKVMNESLAGTNPVYLHSDPLQLLIELGIFGLIPVMYLGIIFVIGTVRSSGQTPSGTRQSESTAVAGLLCGLIAVVVGSCFDFPFRMFSISLVFCGLLATLAYYIDKRRSA